jgi:hypothetical protein
MSNLKQVVIYFLASKLPVIYQPLLSWYLALSKNIGKNNTTPGKFVVKATFIEGTGTRYLLVREMSGSTFRPPSDGSQVSIA